MRLPRSIASFGSAAFESVLRDEIGGDEAGFPLEAFCSSGGYPKLDDVTVDSVVATGDELRVRLTVFFSETVPASCAGSPGVAARVAVVSIGIDRRTGEARVRDGGPGDEGA